MNYENETDEEREERVRLLARSDDETERERALRAEMDRRSDAAERARYAYERLLDEARAREETLQKEIRFNGVADAVRRSVGQSPALVGLRCERADDIGLDRIVWRWRGVAVDVSGHQQEIAVDFAADRRSLDLHAERGAAEAVAREMRARFLRVIGFFYDERMAAMVPGRVR